MSVVRDVTTKLATEYLANLKQWLERKPEDPIDKISTRVATSSALLLRQVEYMIKELKNPRRYLRDSFYPIELSTIIDFDTAEGKSRWNLFPRSRNNHFIGVTAQKEQIYTTHTQHSGIRLEDVLMFLNSAEDVQLFVGESIYKGDKPVATIHTDGTINLHEKKSPTSARPF